MRKLYALLAVIIAVLVLAWIASDNNISITPELPEPFAAAGEILLPGVEGRIDHLAADVSGMRLFVAALGNNSVEVIDLKNGQRLRSISGVKQPQGVLYLPALNRLVVSCAADGTCRVFDGTSLELLHTIKFDLDADNMRYDSLRNLVYVGYGEGALGAFNPQSGEIDPARAINLTAHPESFQLDTKTPDIFVNVPGTKDVAIANRESNAAPLVRHLVTDVENYPMALDGAHQRLFIGCRSPAKLLVMDMSQGYIPTRMPCVGDADDLFYDDAHKRVYVSGGAGFVSTFEQKTADQYVEMAKTTTAPGARTSLYVPELNRLYVACPKKGGQPAKIKIYEVQ